MSGIDGYIEYVQAQIEDFKKASDLIDETKNEVTPMQLNSSLAVFSRVNAALNAEYQRKKYDLQLKKRRFQKWLDTKFVEVKRELSADRPKSYKLGKEEIEVEVRARYADEYEALQDEVTESEMSTEFILRLLDQWKAHAKILEIIASNMRQEIYSLSIDNRMNKREMRVIQKEEDERPVLISRKQVLLDK